MSKEDADTVLVVYRMDQARAALEEALLLHHSGKTTLGVVNRAYYAMFYAVLALLQKIRVCATETYRCDCLI